MLNKAIINLNTVVSNANKIKRKLSKNTLFCAVVKADAYGHGLEKIANSIHSIVDWFAVALVEEGERLRLSGINKNILVLIPPQKADMQRGLKNGLTFAVDSITQLRQINRIAKALKIKAKVHIKYNTGMNRFGLDSLMELRKLLHIAKSLNNVEIEGLFSHLAKPEDKKSVSFATNKFLLAIKVIKSYNNKAICHLSASGGLINNLQFDMVRVGILLYGYLPFPTDYIKVKPAMQLKIPIVKQREIKINDKCLYGEKVNYLTRTASIIRYGYGDGLDRKSVKGQFNNRCMDITMKIDIPKNKRVLTIKSVNQIAKNYLTIDYEILTKIAIRTEKIYIN